MTLFTPDQYSELLARATVREIVPQISVRFSPPTRDSWRRLRRFTRLSRFNGFRFSHRLAFGVDPGTGTEKLIKQLVTNGTLHVDLSAIKRPSEADRELLKWVNEVASA